MVQLEERVKEFVYRFLPAIQDDPYWAYTERGFLYPVAVKTMLPSGLPNRWFTRERPETHWSEGTYRSHEMPKPIDRYVVLDFFGIESVKVGSEVKDMFGIGGVVSEFIGVGVVLQKGHTPSDNFHTYWWLKEHEGQLKLWA